MQEIIPHHLRGFILSIVERGHNSGGVHNVFGAVKAFLFWYDRENSNSGWINPLQNVRLPRRAQAPLDPLALGDFRAMLNTCTGTSLTDHRDRAILLLLLNTGMCQQELIDLTIGHVELMMGDVLVRYGKGRKFRVTFIGTKTRCALNTYFQHRCHFSPQDPLWITRGGKPLSKGGMCEIIRRRARTANIDMPGLYAFRRAFALNCLRNGMAGMSLQRLMGHTSSTTLQRYVALLNDRLRTAHARFGVVDWLAE